MKFFISSCLRWKVETGDTEDPNIFSHNNDPQNRTPTQPPEIRDVHSDKPERFFLIYNVSYKYEANMFSSRNQIVANA